jgi:hypothetical protein
MMIKLNYFSQSLGDTLAPTHKLEQKYMKSEKSPGLDKIENLIEK